MKIPYYVWLLLFIILCIILTDDHPNYFLPDQCLDMTITTPTENTVDIPDQENSPEEE